MKVKIFLVLLLSVFIFGIAGVVAAQSMTDAQRQDLIAQLQQQILLLQQQLVQLLSQQQGPQAWCHAFNDNLGFINSGSSEVGNLHIALQKEGISYSPDNINTYSTGTESGVRQFQAKYGISPQSGWVGPLTRAKLNQLYGCQANTPTPTFVPTPIPTTTPIPTVIPISSITVVSPGSGAHWTAGQRYNITWTSTGIYGSPYVSLSLLNSVGVEEYTIGRVRLDLRTYAWLVPSTISGTWKGPGAYRLKITTEIINSANQYSGLSGWFSVVPPVVSPSITSLSVPGMPIGTNITIFGKGFTSTGNNIKFSILTSAGTVQTGYYQNGIAHSNGTAITFTIPTSLKLCPLLSGQAQCSGTFETSAGIYNIAVVNANGSSSEPTRLGVFTVGTSVDSLPSITVAYPNGGETWQVGLTQQIGWIAKNAVDTDIASMVFLLRDGEGNGYFLPFGGGPIRFGLSNITVPSTVPPGAYKLEAHASIHDLVYSDTSDASFSVVAAP